MNLRLGLCCCDEHGVPLGKCEQFSIDTMDGNHIAKISSRAFPAEGFPMSEVKHSPPIKIDGKSVHIKYLEIGEISVRFLRELDGVKKFPHWWYFGVDTGEIAKLVTSLRESGESDKPHPWVLLDTSMEFVRWWNKEETNEGAMTGPWLEYIAGRLDMNARRKRARKAVYRPMTELEFAQATALGKCKFTPGTFAKRFAREISTQAWDRKEITEKQAVRLEVQVYRYRRQIPARLVPETPPKEYTADCERTRAIKKGML